MVGCWKGAHEHAEQDPVLIAAQQGMQEGHCSDSMDSFDITTRAAYAPVNVLFLERCVCQELLWKAGCWPLTHDGHDSTRAARTLHPLRNGQSLSQIHGLLVPRKVLMYRQVSILMYHLGCSDGVLPELSDIMPFSPALRRCQSLWPSQALWTDPLRTRGCGSHRFL